MRKSNVFEAVKQAVPTRQAAESYGVQVGRNGMACCPFHDDKHPSMKVDRRFHCFGCQADGDVIDFTARLFGLNKKEAALKLAEDFSVSFDAKGHDPPRRRPVKRKISEELRYRQAEQKCFRVLVAQFLADFSLDRPPAGRVMAFGVKADRDILRQLQG